VGRKVELVFDPFDLTRIEVRYQRRPFGTAAPLVIGRHTHPQARRELPPPATGTGIDYLKLLADKRDAELGGHRIDYARLTDGDGDGDGDASLANDGDSDGEDRDINEQEEGQ
jgi:putative transposase